jgi:hypothetical protein
MGAWGYGILQNDAVQDAMLRFIREVRADVDPLREAAPSPDGAGRLAAVVGLLLQLQAPHCFDPAREYAATILAAIERQAPALTALPKTAVDLLGAIRGHHGVELAGEEGPLAEDLYQAFFDADAGFPMERGTGVRHAGMFAHPAGAAYVQEVADRCVRRLSEGFADLGEPPEMWDELADEVAALSALLQLEPCRVDAGLFRGWWQSYLVACAEEDYEEEYEWEYRRCLWRALNHGYLRFSGEPKPAPLPMPERKREEEEDD